MGKQRTFFYFGNGSSSYTCMHIDKHTYGENNKLNVHFKLTPQTCICSFSPLSFDVVIEALADSSQCCMSSAVLWKSLESFSISLNLSFLLTNRDCSDNHCWFTSRRDFWIACFSSELGVCRIRSIPFCLKQSNKVLNVLNSSDNFYNK